MTDATKTKTKKPLWKRWWVIALGAFLLIGIISSVANGGKSTATAALDDQSATTSASPAAAQPAADDSSEEPASAKPTKKAEPAVPAEYLAALVKGQMYSDTMHMSKLGLYKQLSSSYGEDFPKAAAKYAAKHVHANWNKNALAKAKDYREQMSMSANAIHKQLTSSYGEQFTASQADYAIAHLDD